MKKIIFLFLMLVIPVIGFSQGLFKPVSSDMFRVRHLTAPEGATVVPFQSQWIWRFDATVQLSEVLYNKVLKELQTNAVFGIGPAVGLQHFVPNPNGEPFNNYGFGAGVLLGEKMKFVLQANLMQYFKIGFTITPNPETNIFPVGLFFGGGITF
jgi:hypothetical protein